MFAQVIMKILLELIHEMLNKKMREDRLLNVIISLVPLFSRHFMCSIPSDTFCWQTQCREPLTLLLSPSHTLPTVRQPSVWTIFSSFMIRSINLSNNYRNDEEHLSDWASSSSSTTSVRMRQSRFWLRSDRLSDNVHTRRIFFMNRQCSDTRNKMVFLHFGLRSTLNAFKPIIHFLRTEIGKV